MRKREIRGYICGENFSIFDDDTRQAFLRCDALRKDRDLGRHNSGVTFAGLCDTAPHGSLSVSAGSPGVHRAGARGHLCSRSAL